jgi:hypothetical protein
MKSALISLAFFLAAAGSMVAAGGGSNNTDSANNVQSNTSTNVVNVGNGIPTATGGTGGAPLGWNFFHASYCVHFIDTSGNQWTYVFSKETSSRLRKKSVGAVFGAVRAPQRCGNPLI